MKNVTAFLISEFLT